ncbi:glycine dehydrogenase [Chimaeribacter californicus]|nr:glycine dehydrogenase [Chimaeribacter californicus]
MNTAEANIRTQQVLAEIMALLSRKAIYPNAVQQQMLDSHIRAMVLRSLTGEPLPEVEKDLFEDISADSMEMAEQVVESVGNLPIEEAYLLSVHFEVAKENTRENNL